MQHKKTQLTHPGMLVAVLLGLIIAFHLGNALAGKSLIRPSHLGTALEYAHGRIDLLQPVIVGFNATQTPTALEVPLWQAAVASVFKLTHSTWYGWANLVSLLLFATGLWPLFKLAGRHAGERAAWWSLAFFLAQPLVVVLAGKAATDGFCLAATLWFLFFADKMIHTSRWRWWLPATVLASLSAVSKLPFFMTAGLCSAAILLQHGIRNPQRWLMLISAGTIAGLVFLAWNHHCDSLSAQAQYPYMELRISHSPFAYFWYFGDLHMRLSPAVWIKAGWRFLHATAGVLPFAAILLFALAQPGQRVAKYWLIATLVTTLVFTHVVVVHWHYYLMCCPPVALLCGGLFARWEKIFTAESSLRGGQILLVGLALVFSTIDGLIAMKISIDYDPFPKEMSALVSQYTQPGDKLLVFKCDPEWPGEVLFRADRKGLYVPTLESDMKGIASKGLVEILSNETDLQKLKSFGYTKLVLMSESPVRFAIEAANPGSHRRRFFYPETISANVDAWPVIYRSEDLLIKEIP